VKSVREADVVAALTKLRDLLQGDVGVAAQVLKALVGDVVIESRQAEGQEKPQMVARFSLDAMPALAILERNGGVASDMLKLNCGRCWTTCRSQSSPNALKRSRSERRWSHWLMTEKKPPARQREIAIEPHECSG